MQHIHDAWKETARRHGLSEEWAKAKAEVHIAQLQVPTPPVPLIPPPDPAVVLPAPVVPIVVSPPSLTEVHNRLNWIIALLALIAMLLVFSIRSHAQYSHINSISFQNNGVAVTGGFFTYPFVMNFTGTGCTPTVTGSVVSINCSAAGGSGTTLNINGSGVAGTVNLNGTTPAAPAGSQNVTWQYSAGSASAYTPLFPSTKAAVASNFLTSYTSTTGVFTAAQPACGDLSNSGTACQAVAPATIAAVGSKWLNSFTSSTGTFTATQPACGDLSNSGTACQAVAPASITNPGHNFLTTYTSGTGAFAQARPACADLSDAGSGCSSSAGTGTVTSSGSPLIHQVPVFTTATDIKGITVGATNQVLNGNTGADPSWGSVPVAALASSATTVNGATCTLGSTCNVNTGATSGTIALNAGAGAALTGYGGATSCTNQFFTGLSAAGASTCTTATLASAQFANQGTTTTVLHGNGAGNPAFGAVSLANDVTGSLALTSLATQAADTAVVNATAGSAAPTAVAIGSCSSASNALTYNTSTHAFGCNTISGSGTVNSGTTPHLAYYASSTTAVSDSKVSVTVPATGSTLTIADGKTLTATNTMDVAKQAGTAGGIPWYDTTTSQSSTALLTQYGVLYGGGASAAPAATAADTTTTHALFATATSPAFRAIAAGDLPSTLTSGTAITNASLTTPTLGVATATSINKVAFTAPTTAGTIAFAADNSTATLPNGTIPLLVATGTSAMGTGAITTGTCASAVTTSATGTATTDTIIATPNVDPTGVTGYAVSATGSLYIVAYPTSDNVNFKVCNNTAGSLTPSALTLNWKVIR